MPQWKFEKKCVASIKWRFRNWKTVIIILTWKNSFHKKFEYLNIIKENLDRYKYSLWYFTHRSQSYVQRVNSLYFIELE